jgi:hypothetical protein
MRASIGGVACHFKATALSRNRIRGGENVAVEGGAPANLRLACLTYRTSSDDGAVHVDDTNLLGGHRERVAVEDDEIG